MKKTLVAAAALAAFAPLTYAQSSVTLYGLIDEGLAYTNNQKVAPGQGRANTQLVAGANNGDRWGLRGSEDLGNGLHAIFDLENGFSLNTGKFSQGGREFGRQAWVGLASDQYGKVTLGRQYDDVVDYLAPLSLTGTQNGGTQFAHPFDNDNLNNSFRLNNAIKYSSPSYSGLSFGGAYAFSGVAGGFSDNRAYSVGAAYNMGPLNLAAAYMQINNGGANASGAIDGSAATGDAPFIAGRQRIFGAGANYSFGPATVGFVYTQSHLDNTTSVINTGGTADNFATPSSLRFNNYEVNGRYHLSPAITLSAAYTYTDGKLNGVNPKWHQVSAQADYALSKRTDVYVQGEYQHQLDAQNTPLYGASILGVAQSASPNQVVATVGMRHRF